MGEKFVYEWQEYVQKKKLSASTIKQALLLALFVGTAPDIILMLTGHSMDVHASHFMFMLLVVPGAVLLLAAADIFRCRKMKLTSTLTFDNGIITVTRHVLGESGRMMYLTWTSTRLDGLKVEKRRSMIQAAAVWEVSTFRMQGRKIGKRIDVDSREYTQTFWLPQEKFLTAISYLESHFQVPVTEMTQEEYEKALPFIYRHYGNPSEE